MSRVLVFIHATTCGHSRRMDSIVDHFLRANRGALGVAKVEVTERADIVERLGVTSAPALVLLDSGREVARLEGRATLPDMKLAFEPHLGVERPELSIELAGAC